MGAWVVVEHRPDDIVVLRRNPYYWKVDEAGQQLPYLDEMHYRLSTWGDRDVQAVAGTGDFSNLEQAGKLCRKPEEGRRSGLARRVWPLVRAPSATRCSSTCPPMAGASPMHGRRPCAS